MKIFLPNYYLLSLLLLTFLSISFLVYQQIFSGTYGSDTAEHVTYVYQLFSVNSTFYIPHPLWHLGVKITSVLLHISIEYAAVFFSATLITLWTYLVYTVAKERLLFIKAYKLTLITLIIIIIGPLCLPWINKIIFLGQGSPNIWHNVTLWAVKPLALLSMIYVIQGIRTNKIIYYALTIIMVVLSLFAKPSFAIVFLPALAVFVFFKKLVNKQFVWFYLVLVILSCSILLYQFLHTFNTGDTKIIFDFLGVWSHSSQNIGLSIFLALAFPLLFVLLEINIINDDYILLSWVQIFIGIIYYATLAESGKYYFHGNFGWSYAIAMSLLYVFSIIKFFEIYNNIHAIKRYFLLFILLSQIGIGVYYFTKVLLGQNPLYISIMY